MSGQLNLTVFLIFLGSVAAVVGLGLFVITLVLDARHKHRKRLNRVGRRRLSGKLDFEEARLNLLKSNKESNTLVSVSDALSRIFPLLNTTRLRANIHRAGMSLSIGSFILISLIIAAMLTAGAVFATGLPLPLLVLPGVIGGMFLLDIFVKFRGTVMANRFMKQLPDALDTIIRGIRSGLPVIECVGTVGQEYEAPIGPYFQMISERVQLGEPLEGALWRVARVIDKPEMDFLAISISIQMETGGSLAEALGNLADLLRKREQMKLKIKAISSEARASAMIIGALPFLMLALLSSMAPEYVAPLFTDPRGHMMLGAALGSISIGAFVMWRMTQFEI
jgi:tight adherence protein B